MGKRRDHIARALSLLLVFAFVAIQVLDLAVLDAQAIASPDPHVAGDQAPGPGGSDDDAGQAAPDGCIVHCGCHALHHMGLDGHGAELSTVLPIDHRAPANDRTIRALGESPPVPPPLT